MITLKEAFRQQAFLQGLQRDCWRLLGDEDFCTRKTEKHLKAKALPGQENEEIDISEPRRHKVADIIAFCHCVQEEEEKLAHAVHKAKAALGFGLDAAVIANKSRRSLAQALRQMAEIEPRQSTDRGGGMGYILDKDGKPATFSYDIETAVAIDFDRNKVKKQARKLFEAAERTSLEIDKALLREIVDYEPKFDPNGSMQAALDDFLPER